ncbi:helix-turn-helix domain-containing protein [Frankia sp. AvcI1]|uniref:helix-turn-helix domain-containing protein n=1 Tax=Frankia sp. AvcI1 TaxID=573496 RepID=UPI0035AE169E
MTRPGARPRSTHALAEAIDATGMTRRAFALRAGCSHSAISHLIGGRNGATPELAARIEKTAGVKPGSLFAAAASGQICRCAECAAARK